MIGVEYRFDNYILKAFLASGLLAVVIMVLALGLIQLFRYGPGLPISITLILAAIAFVLSASFFERYEVGSIMWSMLVSIIATLILALLSGGIIYAFTENIHPWEEMLSGFAICVIISMTLLSYLKRSLGEIEY
ncbi:hypothetical protein [Methanothrix sp.]|jgi:phosphate/sulfate permease|uniref:hypothetical protein n=1 Tax=Methanothrix sp. TaxID=90426 RepID=UPI0025E67504|nr:hypothetical protein [Methanothrix sp.]MDI9416391.1 hypothetical protein [Euryarchaeota archaeon]HON34752.1 hypothetical protein [Methanothrix sp.]HRU74609.1 hypothetical protein [Methanothrix sp.]